MANFDEFKQVAAEKAEIIAGKAAELARTAAEKTKLMAKIGKLNAEILAEKETIRKSNTELGKIYYEYFKVDPHEPMKELCARIDSAYATIAAKKAEIEDLKAANVTVEVKETAPAEEACCCAEKAADEVKEAAEDACSCAEKAAEEVKEAAEDACSCAEKAADEVKEAAEDACCCAEKAAEEVKEATDL